MTPHLHNQILASHSNEVRLSPRGITIFWTLSSWRVRGSAILNFYEQKRKAAGEYWSLKEYLKCFLMRDLTFKYYFISIPVIEIKARERTAEIN